MTRRLTSLSSLAVLLSLSTAMSGQNRPVSRQPSVAGDWPYYTGDVHGTKYSWLDQINVSNFKDLEVAWRFKTDILGPRAEYKLEGETALRHNLRGQPRSWRDRVAGATRRHTGQCP
jgi:quinoprotein glucose dehydrogenase